MPFGKQIINTLQLDVVDPIVVRCPDVDCAELVVIIELTIDVTYGFGHWTSLGETGVVEQWWT
jgi:hypothetical protein